MGKFYALNNEYLKVWFGINAILSYTFGWFLFNRKLEDSQKIMCWLLSIEKLYVQNYELQKHGSE